MRQPDGRESPEDRRARAAALLAGLEAKAPAPRPRPATPEDVPLVDGIEPEVAEALAGLDLHRRRHGLGHVARSELRKLGCRTFADVAALSYRRCVNWLGFREADLVRARAEAVVAEARAGKAEPGIARMVEDLDDETRSWLLSRPVEDVAGRGIARKVAAALRAAGHESLGALATEEADAVEDVAGIGPHTVAALRARLAGIVAEGADAPSRGRRRRLSAEDAEWDAAAPD